MVLFLFFQTKDYSGSPYKWTRAENVDFSDAWQVQIDGKKETYKANLPKIIEDVEPNQ